MFSMHECVPTKAQVESQLTAGAALADTVMDGMHRVTDLNLNLARSALQQSNLAVRQLANAEDTCHFMTLTVAQLQPATQRLFDYGYYLLTIASAMQSAMLDLLALPHECRPDAVTH